MDVLLLICIETSVYVNIVHFWNWCIVVLSAFKNKLYLKSFVFLLLLFINFRNETEINCLAGFY